MAKNLSDAQKEYYMLYRDPFVRISLKFLTLLSKYIIKPIMKRRNATTSSLEYLDCIQKVLSDIEKLRQSNLEEVCSSFQFSSPLEKEQFLVKSRTIFHLILDGCLHIFQKWDPQYIQKTKENGKDRFVICSNRQAERYISYIKQQLDKNSNIRLVIIMSFCKLRHLNFSFHSFPKEWRSVLKKQGRNLYNNAITRKKINQQKAFLYFQQLEQKIEKQAKIDRCERIKAFLVDMGYMSKEHSLTVDKMKAILVQLRNKGHYNGDLNLGTKNKYLVVFEKKIMR